LRLHVAWKSLWFRLGSAPAGMPSALPSHERAGRILGFLSVLWIALVGFWGIAGPFPEGHYASAAAIGTAGANMWRLHIIYPVPYVIDHPVSAANYYMHHPMGLFWVAAAFIKVLGETNVAIRLPAILVTTFTPVFLYRTARALFGPLEAGLAALTFVAVPITMGFANYLDLEGPVTFGCVVATWGYVRLVQSWRPRFTWPCVLGVIYAVGHDWESGVWLGALLILAFTWAYVGPGGRRQAVDYRTFGRCWALMVVAGIVPLMVSAALLFSSGRLDDLLGSYTQRTTGNQAPLSAVLTARHVRIELMFTPIAIALGKLALPVIIARFVRTRDHLELVSLPLLLMATVYYVLFKNGADTHIFWPRPFMGYLPLGVAAIAASLRQGGAWLADRGQRAQIGGAFDWRRARHVLPWAAFALVALPLLLIFRDGASLLRLARESGGRFIEANLESDIDMVEALRWFLRGYPPTEKIGFHTQLWIPWSVQWEIRPHFPQIHQPLSLLPPVGSRLYMLDTRLCSPGELKDAATRFHVLAVGNLWFMDRAKPPAPLDGFRLAEREPGPLSWALQGGVEPVRTVEPDPFVTWELRTAVGQKATLPGVEPIDPEQIRIAYNAALDLGRAADQAKLRARLLAGLNLPVHATYENGTKLLGAYHHRGAARSLTLLFESGKFTAQVKYTVNALVTGRTMLSTLPVDPADFDIAPPPPIPTPMWVPGHLYSLKVVYRRRAGHERLTGAFQAGPRRTDGAGVLPLLRL
jgi:Dolichyl-phosphate-mannose-protein mannosyltransferase